MGSHYFIYRPQSPMFFTAIQELLVPKILRSGVAESQKLSSGANVKDYHAQNDRTGPFQPEIILIEYLVHM